MPKMYFQVFGDLRRAKYHWTSMSKTLDSRGGEAYELKTPAGEIIWVKCHTRDSVDSRRYWIGINRPAISQVNAFVFWAQREPFLYLVPASFLSDILERVPEERITMRGVRWLTHVYADFHELQLPYYYDRFKLDDFVVRLPAGSS